MTIQLKNGREILIPQYSWNFPIDEDLINLFSEKGIIHSYTNGSAFYENRELNKQYLEIVEKTRRIIG